MTENYVNNIGQIASRIIGMDCQTSNMMRNKNYDAMQVITAEAKRIAIAKEILQFARILIAENGTPDLYLLQNDGTIIPIQILHGNAITATDKQAQAVNEGVNNKKIFLTQQAYGFYQQMDEKNKKDFRSYCSELQTRGTLEGNTHGEKISGTNNIFCIRLTLGESNERFFYCYKNGNIIIVFNAYTKKTRTIPRNELNKARKIVKQYMHLQSMEGFKPFDEIKNKADEKENHANNDHEDANA